MTEADSATLFRQLAFRYAMISQRCGRCGREWEAGDKMHFRGGEEIDFAHPEKRQAICADCVAKQLENAGS